jgi:hypothetical protein
MTMRQAIERKGVLHSWSDSGHRRLIPTDRRKLTNISFRCFMETYTMIAFVFVT